MASVETRSSSPTTRALARLTEDLSRFNLDFVLPVQRVTVNGQAAAFRRVKRPGDFGIELEVSPAAGLPRDTAMTVVVGYSARPATIKRNGYSNWLTTPTGLFVDRTISGSMATSRFRTGPMSTQLSALAIGAAPRATTRLKAPAG
jgi:hypothetical protein